MTQGITIKLIIFLYCINQITYCANQTTLHLACLPTSELGNKQARDGSPCDDVMLASTLTPPSLETAKKNQNLIPLDPTALQLSATILQTEEIPVSLPDSPKLSPSSPVTPIDSTSGMVEEKNALTSCSQVLKAQYYHLTSIRPDTFEAMLRLYKTRDLNQPDTTTAINSAIIPFKKMIQTHLPNASTNITLSATPHSDVPTAAVAVEKNNIVFYPGFFNLTSNQQEAELQLVIANIKTDDYYWLNTMHRYHQKISSKLTTEQHDAIEHLLEVYHFVRIQIAFIEAQLTTKNTEVQTILHNKYKQTLADNRNLAKQVKNIQQDPTINARIDEIVLATHNYLMQRQQEDKERERIAQKAITPLTQKNKRRRK